MPHDLENGFSAGDEIIGDNAAVASPPYCLRTHYRAAPFASLIERMFEARMKLRGKRIIGIAMKTLVRPEICPSAKTAEYCHVFIGNVEGRQSVGKRVLIELRIGSRPRNRSDIRDKINFGSTQQLDELLETSVGMADREEWKLHASPLLRCVFHFS